jgi:hypothetical protein
MGLVHIILFAVFCFVIGPHRKYWHPFQFRRAALFFGLLLLVGAIFDGLWSCEIYGRLYYTMDYFFDFIPFVPFSKGEGMRIDGSAWGGLNGVTPWQVQLVWLVFAAGAWSSTVFFYRLICRRWPFNVKQLLRRNCFWKCQA